MFELWYGLIDALGSVLRFFHGLLAPVFGGYSWGFAIILLTVAVRVVLLPLAVKQIHNMRVMQKLQPELKKIQSKYKVDRGLMRTDPEKYRAQRQKQSEAMMALYKEHNANPASGCLPLIAQMPVFFALYTLLRDTTRIPELESAGFLLVDSLSAVPAQAGIGAYLLVVLMALTTFVSQRQMMAANPTAQQMPQQRMLLYLMPVILAFFSIGLPVGVLLYWVTTNLWTMAQQWYMFRNVEQPAT